MRSRTPALIASGVAVIAVAVVVVGAVVVLRDPPARGSGEAQAPAAPSAGPTASSTPHALPTDIGEYVALGDSYAAGVGGGDEQGSCQRSPFSYPSQLDGTAGILLIDNVACAAATTENVVAGQLHALSRATKLVTVSVGGNDLNVQALAEDCAGESSGECGAAFSSALTLMKTLPAKLRATYRAVAAAAPDATIVVTGYPTLFDSPKTNSLTLTSSTLLNAATDELDSLIRAAVASEHGAGVDIHYVGVDFDGHGIGSPSPWIVTSGRDVYHPTETGYRAYARAILGAL